MSWIATKNTDLGLVRLKERPELAGRERCDLIAELFHLLDESRLGRLGSAQLRRFADSCGFRGTCEDWNAEYAGMCTDSGCDAGDMELVHFARIVDDRDGACFQSDTELAGLIMDLSAARHILAPVREEVPQEEARGGHLGAPHPTLPPPSPRPPALTPDPAWDPAPASLVEKPQEAPAPAPAPAPPVPAQAPPSAPSALPRKGGGIPRSGEIIRASGAVYTGQVDENGLASGTGSQRWPNGDVYEGQWADDRMAGIGSFSMLGGGTYEGAWAGGRQHGQGSFRAPDKSCYTGQWQVGLMHGEGEYSWADGAVYKGQFLKGTRTGQGCIQWESGTSYDGPWRRDREHGVGVFTSKDGRQRTGEWADGQRVRWLDGNDGATPKFAFEIEQPAAKAAPEPQRCADRCVGQCAMM